MKAGKAHRVPLAHAAVDLLSRLPREGEYVFPGGLAPLTVDREADAGAYWEPNVWMRHHVPSA